MMTPSSAEGAAAAAPELTAALLREPGRDFTGCTFGPYQVLGEIARGGMGVLFRARQTNPLAADPKTPLPEEIALKVILTRQGALAAATDTGRFISEVRVLITLQHPNVVRIWDAGKENGLHFYTMELVKGPSLKDMARDRPLPLVLALSVVREVAGALDALHGKRLLHRDVKPANILMDRQTSPFRPVLIDFGLIQPVDGGLRDVAGTPGYMAPEATDMAGAYGPVGPATDLYALGAVLYFLITRRSPFTGTRAEEVIEQVRKEPVKPPRAIVPELPAEVEAIVLRCLEKRPEGRYASMGELCGALDREIRGARRSIQIENKLLRYRRMLFGGG